MQNQNDQQRMKVKIQKGAAKTTEETHKVTNFTHNLTQESMSETVPERYYTQFQARNE